MAKKGLDAYREYNKLNDTVVCNYGYRIRYNDDGTHTSYNKWNLIYKKAIGSDLFFGSGGGTLFQPSKLCPDISKLEKALELTPTADDIWLNAMVKMAGLNICILSNGTILEIRKRSKISTRSTTVMLRMMNK